MSRSGQVVLDALPEALRPFQWTRTAPGAFSFAQFAPGKHLLATIEWDQQPPPESEPMTLDELRAAVRRVIGQDLAMRAPTGLRRRVGSNARQAERYRAGRTLLVGDAAHVHPAVGGPGLDLGLQDGLNLAWKLAAEVRGGAPPGLLDTYESERRPVGRRVLLHTQAQMALLSPGDDVGAVRELFGALLDEGGVRRRIAELLAGADVRYEMPAQAHPLLGRWMPDLPLRAAGATRAAELMRSGRPLLLDFTGALTAPRNVDYVRADTDEPPADGVLIRPDGYVAWAGGAGLTDAAAAWFGTAVRA